MVRSRVQVPRHWTCVYLSLEYCVGRGEENQAVERWDEI